MTNVVFTCSYTDPMYSCYREGQNELTGEVVVVDLRLGVHVVSRVIHQLEINMGKYEDQIFTMPHGKQVRDRTL